MSLDIRDMFKRQSNKLKDKKSAKDKGSKRPIVIEDDDDDFDKGIASQPTSKSGPSSDNVVRRRKRPLTKGLQFDSDSDDDIPSKMIKKEIPPKKSQRNSSKKSPKKSLEKSPHKPPSKNISKSPQSKIKLVSSALEFFGDQPIKRTESLTKATPKKTTPKKTTPRKATPKKITPRKATPRKATPRKSQKVMSKKLAKVATGLAESPVVLDEEDEVIEDFGIDDAEMSQVLDEIEEEMEQPLEEESKDGTSNKRHHSPGAEDHTPSTPPVKKLKKMADEAKVSSSTKTAPFKLVKTPSKPPKEIESKDTPTSPVKGSTPSLTRGSSYRAYLQRQQAGPANPGSKPIPEGKPNCLLGLTFVVTGELDSLYRDQCQDLVKRYGGKVTSSLSKKTSYLVVGREPGQSKMAKAKEVGTKILNEDELLELIRTLPGKGQSCEDTKAVKTTSSSTKTTSSSTKTTSSSTKTTSSSTKTTSSSMKSTSSSTTDEAVTTSSVGRSGQEMWVDKYKPTSLKQIIGQQGEKSCANKLLRWLRNWEQNRTTGAGGGKKAWGWGGGDGSQFKAALLSGPPGIGKTTTATLACKEAGFEYTELNASDTRSRRGLEETLTTQLGNTSITAFRVGGAGVMEAGRHAVIMDEVDGMAGNEDRGGIQELIQLIKRSRIPVICICNDRQHQKIRSLANYCYDLRFYPPRNDQVKAAMMSIAYKEGLKIPPSALEEVVVSCGQDIRQVIHTLSLWTASGRSLPGQANPQRPPVRESKMSPFDVVRKLFSCQEPKLSLHQKTDLFFQDYSFIPLFVQENYISIRPEGVQSVKDHLKCLNSSADALALGDIVERRIRSGQEWKLLPLQAIYSCAIPGGAMRGYMSHQIAFPQWLGSNSKGNKVRRMLSDLQVHTRTRTLCNKSEFGMDYLPRLATNLTHPLMSESTDGVAEVVECLDDYCLTRDDWDSIVDISHFPGKPDVVARIPTKVKSAFTRTYNKGGHLLPYSTLMGKKLSKRKPSDSTHLGDEEGEELSEGSDSDDVIVASTVKPSKGKGKKTSSQSSSQKTSSQSGSQKASSQSGGNRKTTGQKSKGSGKGGKKKAS